MLALAFTKRLSKRHQGTLFTVLSRVAQKTSHIFLALAAARLVVGYTDPPPHVFQTVNVLFTIAAVLQVARWLRAALFSVIDSQSSREAGSNEALANASGLIRALVNAALIVVGLIVILDNVGVNVTGLVAGLGIGGIAIGLAAQGIFSDLFASLSIIFDQPFRVGETIDFGKGPGDGRAHRPQVDAAARADRRAAHRLQCPASRQGYRQLRRPDPSTVHLSDGVRLPDGADRSGQGAGHRP